MVKLMKFLINDPHSVTTVAQEQLCIYQNTTEFITGLRCHFRWRCKDTNGNLLFKSGLVVLACNSSTWDNETGAW